MNNELNPYDVEYEDFKIGMWVKIRPDYESSETVDWYTNESLKVTGLVLKQVPDGSDLSECVVVDRRVDDEDDSNEIWYGHLVPDYRKNNLNELLD